MRALPMLLPLFLAACAERPRDTHRVAPEETLLQVSATGRAETAPTEARFTAGVESIAPSAAAASEANNQTINKVLAALDGLSVRKEDVQTRQVSLQRIGYGPNRGRFQANNMVEVKVRDVARAGDAIAAATEAGANVLSGPNLTVGDPEKARNAAHAEAFKAARARAEAYAGAAGLKIVRILSIRDGMSGHQPYPGYDMNMSGEASAPPQVSPVSAPMIRPGLNTSQAAVQVDFALAPR
ncbi:MAG TPA: SIMPL domain-containing protein [Allosphingosinicella sp.]|nr:SIMPL domain-containing protein [Allosphingosinicella sp.]